MTPLHSVRMQNYCILANTVKAKDVRSIKERDKWHC